MGYIKGLILILTSREDFLSSLYLKYIFILFLSDEKYSTLTVLAQDSVGGKFPHLAGFSARFSQSLDFQCAASNFAGCTSTGHFTERSSVELASQSLEIHCGSIALGRWHCYRHPSQVGTVRGHSTGRDLLRPLSSNMINGLLSPCMSYCRKPFLGQCTHVVDLVACPVAIYAT